MYWKFISRAIGTVILFSTTVLLWVIGTRNFRRLRIRNEASDEFSVEARLGRKRFVSRAKSLRSGHVRVLIGAALLDLSQAGLDDSGAQLQIDVTMGNALLRIPEEWDIHVEPDGFEGEVDIEPSDPSLVAGDAPPVTLKAVVRRGSIRVSRAA